MNRKFFRFIWDICRERPRDVIVTVVVWVLMSLFGASALFVLSPMIDLYLHPAQEAQSALTIKVIMAAQSLGIAPTFWNISLLFILFIVISTGLNILGWKMILHTKYSFLRSFILNIFQDFFSAKWAFFSQNDQGKLYNSVTREITVVGDSLASIGLMFASLIQAVILFLVPFYISWQATLFCVGFGVGAGVLISLLSKTAYLWGQQNTRTANDLSRAIHESLTAAKIVLGYGRKDRTYHNVLTVFDQHKIFTVRSQVLNYAITAAYRPIGFICVVAVLVFSRWVHIQTSEIGVLLLALFQGLTVLGAAVANRNKIINVVPSYEQIVSLRTLAQEMKQPSGGKMFQDFSSAVTLKNVSFAHREDQAVLQDVNITIPRGKMVALVGRSGAGKSTLIDIVMGFHEIERGDLLVDGQSLFEYDICSYRGRIGYVPQDGMLFNMSIRENLLWASPSATEKDMSHACELAYAAEFIEALPEKYETVVGDRGVRLSGGQVQRLALARAFLKNPALLALDEATSALDSHSERQIQRAIDNFARETTLLVVAHRLSTIRRADIIYVLDEGRVVEEGDYHGLTAKNGLFARMVKMQEFSSDA